MKHPYDKYIKEGGAADSPLAKYLNGLKKSNCPACGRPQYSPRGEPIYCPTCVSGKESVARPSVPMLMKGRRRRRG